MSLTHIFIIKVRTGMQCNQTGRNNHRPESQNNQKICHRSFSVVD